MSDDRTVQTIAAALEGAPGIRALFLSGSHGNGRADAFSDIDFILVCDQGASDAVAALWRQAIEKTGEIVLWWDRQTVPVLINAITADWTRTDVLMLKPEQISHYAQDTIKPVFDPDDMYSTLPVHAKPAQQSPARFTYQIEEFIRVMGLLHLAAGREEYLNGVLGVYHLRNLLVDLMIEDTGAPDRGGVLHLNRLITEDQKDVLRALAVPQPTRDGMIDAHLAYAAAYLPMARARAAAMGVAWPERFEAVTWAKLKETLGVERPY